MKRFKKEGTEGQEPTKAELAVLQVLWRHGPSTVRTVHDALNEGREAAQYTTTLKLMQLMTEKGMLLRDESSMKHVYRAALEEKGTKGQLLNRFIDTMYHGSVGNMMVALLGNEKTSTKDLQQLRELLEKLEKKEISMIQAICWTLVHSLWQGLLFAMITGVVMLLTRQASAAVRYNVLCVLFFLFLAVCAGTFIYEGSLIGRLTEEGTLIAAADNGNWMTAWIIALGSYCSEHAVLIVWGWLFVFTIKSLRMLGSYLYTQRVRHYRISEAPEGWQERVDRLAGQMGIQRAVRLVESQIVKMPLVIGHLRPMILMPLGLITGVPGAEIEAVLLHELAHIRRHDYIVNFLQNVAVNIFFFNPGFLWMSSLLREERENCCDDIAVARTHDRAGFIRALISFKEHDLRLAGVANAFPGKKNQLIKRAMRIAESTNKTLDPVEKIFLVLSFILISALVAATSGSSPVSPAGVAQIPGGKYRFFVDTPARDVQVPVLKKSVTEPAIRRIMKDRRETLETKERVYANAAIVEAKGRVDAIENNRMAKLAMMDARAAQGNEQAVLEKKQAVDEAMQFDRDAQQAVRDREQAVRDKHQAERDAQQALVDKAQAERDAKQYLLDKQQAERDAQQAIKDREQAERDRTNNKHISP